ncbi:MAG: hypothetical protein HLUCCO02_05400 [Idiomarinaceae bacterium HL-53]|nr:MAG: hypothetical protein HLUCCO02_05400 [Idiomarinaceae bacterium HL-53]
MANNSEAHQFTDGQLGRDPVCAKFARTAFVTSEVIYD